MKLGDWSDLNLSYLDCGYDEERTAPFDIFDPYGIGLAEKLRMSSRIKVDGQQYISFDNASVFSYRMVCCDDRLYTDFPLDRDWMSRYIEGHFDVPIKDHRITLRNGDDYESELIDYPPIEIPGCTAMLTSSEHMNYGAWIIRVLPKIWIAEASRLPIRNYLIFAPTAWQKNLLSWAGLDQSTVIYQDVPRPYTVNQLIFPTWPNRNKFIHRDAIARLRGLRDRAALRQPGFRGPNAIYVSRLSWAKRLGPAGRQYRPFPQEEEFADRLERLGVVPFCPEEHDMDTVALVFGNANLIVGPQGAGMFNSVFCRPGTTVIDIEHLPNFLLGHANLFASCGVRYSIVVGRAADMQGAHPVQMPLEIDLEAVIGYVARTLDSV